MTCTKVFNDVLDLLSAHMFVANLHINSQLCLINWENFLLQG